MIERRMITEESRSWLRTPYRKQCMIKGVGVDCGMFPYMVLSKLGLVPDLSGELPVLKDWQVLEQTDDWFCHTSEQRYARIVERYFRRLIESQARREFSAEFSEGNLVLLQTKGSRVYNHGGLITSWPRVIHCFPPNGVSEVDASVDPYWSNQKIAVYDVLEGSKLLESRIVQEPAGVCR